MKSFYNKSTGVTLTPKNKWVEEQLEADTRFEVAGAKGSKNSGKKEDTNENKNNQNIWYLPYKQDHILLFLIYLYYKIYHKNNLHPNGYNISMISVIYTLSGVLFAFFS